MVPSRIPLAKPEIVVIGVFSSWDTLAIKFRRSSSAFSRESAMALKERVSSPISSSRPSSSTRIEKSPRANRWAAKAISFMGFACRLEVTKEKQTAMSIMTMATARNTIIKVPQASTIVELSEPTNTYPATSPSEVEMGTATT